MTSVDHFGRRLGALLIALVSGACLAQAQWSSTPDPRILQIPAPQSVSCEQRSICGDLTSTSSPHPSFLQSHQPSFARNCRCDELCAVYDDCCTDFRSTDSSSSTLTSLTLPYNVPRTVVTCQRMPDHESGRSTSEIYVVTRCRPDHDDDYVRQRCEKQSGSGSTIPSGGSVDHDDRFYRLPVRGGPPLNLLYRNAYCAVCAGEQQPHLVFWKAVLRCSSNPITTALNSTLFRSLSTAGCTAAIAPSRESLSLPVPRPCKVNIGRCDRSWTNRTVARWCRERTDYVYAGNRAFRNRACAACNYINETYIRCEEGRPTAAPSLDNDGANNNNKKVVLEENVPLVVQLDLNARRALLSAEAEENNRKSGSGAMLSTVAFPVCDEGGVYDPFVDDCRLLFCRQGAVLRGGSCVVQSKPETRLPPEADDFSVNSRDYDDDDDDDDYLVHPAEVTTDAAVTSSEAATTHVTTTASGILRCRFLLPVNASDFRRLDNGSVYVVSLRRLFPGGHVIWQNGSPSVCVRRDVISGDDVASPTNADDVTGDDVISSNSDDVISSNSNDVTGDDVASAFLSPRYNFTMFRFADESGQRSVALVGAVVCLVALFLHLLVYAMFTSLWTNTDGKSVLCLAASLFFAQLLYLFVILVTDDFPGPAVCFVASHAMQYCFLAAFCWLNVVSIDVFRWLRSSEASTASTYSYIAEECCTRFVWYSLYAWTVPFIVVTGSVTTAVLRIDGWHPYDQRSGGGCWVMGLSQLMLFSLPISLLLTVNLVLYLIAACRLCFETIPARFQHHRNKYKRRIIVSMQLSVLMGLAWTLAVVAVVSGWTFLWYLFILFDTLQGLFVCGAFVCTPKVWRLFCSKGRVRRLSEGGGGGGGRSSGGSRYRGNGVGTKGGTASGRGKMGLRDPNNRVIMLETSI